ncbi:uL15 family ribosomal protein [Thermoproteus tenax]|uniref:Large ribosomal subunit protein uL15 n=1 Tax=Thermoproteus tenax (strain ATCC 35583 / DSM 2078 / JCM 9277 / NBRC 100435 / Kra 1) TaxID=768679 RepID=G4RKF2_THETK|nr:uL15 family ribosomal protein [Thermoproteus tenax]CCC82047.1 putative secreted protein [Thermoproteus tenax Kra 1]
MVRRFKPAVKYRRGSRTHGWGRVGQHRKSGSSGGKGMVGFHKHKWSFVMVHAEETSGWPFYGKHGFKQPKEISIQWRPINVGKLDDLVEELEREGVAVKEGEKYVVDLLKLGYNKLLGGGSVKRALIVYTATASEAAVKKISAAGGEVRIVQGVIHR